MQSWLMQSIKSKLWLIAAAGLVLAAVAVGVGRTHAESSITSPPPSSADVFLKLDDVPGESADAQHAGQIEVSSFDWGSGLQNTASSGSGAGKVTVHDLSITKYVDKSSPVLMKACATGTHFNSAIIVVRKAGGTQQDYLTYTLEDVLVSSYSVSDSGQPTEHMSLSFGKISVEYKPQKPDGSLDAAVSSSIDQLLNRTQ
jgi:type VI secretion system secreted protein Hcp